MGTFHSVRAAMETVFLTHIIVFHIYFCLTIKTILISHMRNLFTLNTNIHSVLMFQTNLFTAPPSEYNGNPQL